MEKQIKEAIEIIENVRKSMPECTNKAFLKGALNELNEALNKAKVFSPNAVLAVTSDSKENKKESEVALPLNISIWRKARKMDYVEFCKWFNQFKGNDR